MSYAEGYRSPTLTETLVVGAHPTGGGPGAFVCPDGNSGFFCFQQNFNLRPEVGKNKEIVKARDDKDSRLMDDIGLDGYIKKMKEKE